MFNNFDLLKTRTQIPISHVQIVPKFLHPHEITAINNMINEYPYQEASVLGSEQNQGMVLRQSQLKWMVWNDNNWWIYTKIRKKAEELNNSLWNFDLYGINEYIQYTEYRSTQNNRGHYDWHLDVSHEGLTSNRKLTFECVLSDDHAGGDFSMLLGPSENRFKLNEGDAVIYPSFLMNKIYPVTSGIRTSIVSWISGPSFK